MKGGPQTWDELEDEPVSAKRACISLYGTRIAAVFADKSLCIYDTTTGEATLPPFEVDENPDKWFSLLMESLLPQVAMLFGCGNHMLKKISQHALSE